MLNVEIRYRVTLPPARICFEDIKLGTFGIYFSLKCCNRETAIREPLWIEVLLTESSVCFCNSSKVDERSPVVLLSVTEKDF